MKNKKSENIENIIESACMCVCAFYIERRYSEIIDMLFLVILVVVVVVVVCSFSILVHF